MLVEREDRRELTGIPRTGASDVPATPGKQTLIEAVSSPASGQPSPGQRPADADARAAAPRAAAGTTPAPIGAQGAAAGVGPRSLADPLRACFGRPHAPVNPGLTGGGGEQGPAALAADTPLRARPTRGLISHVGASPRTRAAFETTDHAGKEDPLGDAGDRRAKEALPYRREMEAAFDVDFSSVGVRTGCADELASIHAKASATGEEISFADRQPDRRTVAHELAHVMQHRRHGAGTGGVSQPGDAAEREAEAIAAAVDAGQAAPAVHHPAVTRSEPPAGAVDGDLGAPNRAVQRDKVGPEPNAAAGATGAPQPRSGPEAVTAASAADHAHEDRLPPAADGSTRAAPRPHAGAAMHDRSRAPAPADRPPVPAPEGEPGGVHAATQPVSAALEGTRHALDELSPGVRLSELDTATRRAAQRAAASCPATRHQALGVPHASSLGRRDEGVPPVAHPGAPPPRGQVTTTIEHARLVTDPHPARPDGISAGPRPSVALRGGSDPASAAAALHEGQDQIDARLAGSHERSIADHGVSRLSAPIPRRVAPAPALEIPAVAVPAIAESPLRAVPSELRARIDERAAPALDRKLAAVTAAATADHEQSTAELAALQTEHAAQATARTEAAHAQVTALRTRGRAQVDAVRGQWQARSRAEYDEFTRQAHAAHAAMHTEVQGMVRDGEQRSGAILADGESRAGARKVSAEGRAASILAGAEARAAAARARSPATGRSIARQATDDAGGGGSAQSGNDDQAGEILRLAKLEVDAEMARARADMAALVADAGSLSDDQIRIREQAIAQRIDELKAKLDQTVRQVLGSHFPRMEQAYVGQIDSLLGDVHAGMDKVADALVSHDAQATSKAVAAASDLLTRRSKRLDATLDDVATLSSFQDGNVDSALAKFGIKTAGFKDSAATKGYDEDQDLKQDILFEAIRVENAMRAADGKHVLATPELSQPGAAFNAMFNEGQGLTISRSGDKGGLTPGPDKVRLGGLNPDKTDWIANAIRFQVGHEFGHAFNFGMIFSQIDSGSGTAVPYQHPYQDRDGKTKTSGRGAFDAEPIMLGNELVAGGDGSKRYIPDLDDLSGFLASKRDSDLDAIEKAYAGQGMRFSRQSAEDDPSGFYNKVKSTTSSPWQDVPYQQDLISENGEWFADVFVNWANGTLADNAEGDAIDAWMNHHMQDWIEMGLAADQTKLPATATPKG
jgi:hypothetical protein